MSPSEADSRYVQLGVKPPRGTPVADPGILRRTTSADKAGPRSRTEQNDVMLIAMPFAIAVGPSIGLSLLQAGLARRGIGSEIRYFNITFARRIDDALHNWIAARQLRLLGEWVFAPSLSGITMLNADGTFWADALHGICGDGFENNIADLKEKITSLQHQAEQFIDESAASVDWTRYRIVGFSSTYQQDMASLALARRIKQASPETIVVFGGAHCEAEMGAARLRNFPFIDYVFSGAADATFPRFVESILTDAPLDLDAGFIRRHPVSGEVVKPSSWVSPVHNLDDLPYPNYDDYFEQLGERDDGMQFGIPFETARGCWWGEKAHCTFCGLNGMTMPFQRKSPQRVLDEFAWLSDRYCGPKDTMVDVSNILDMSYFDDVIPKLAQRKEKPRLFFETKSNLSPEQVQALANAGVQKIQPGIESLSTPVLKLMRKGCTMLQNIQLLKSCAGVGIEPTWNLLYGFPREDPESYREMEQLIPLISHLPAPTCIGQVRLDRFSPYFRDSASLGIVNVQPHRLYNKIYPVDQSEIRDIAYYFEYDYADGRDLQYVDPLIALIEEWMNGVDRHSLVGFARDEGLLVWDTRTVATSEWTELRGVWADLIRFCAVVRSRNAVRRFLCDLLGRPASDEEVEQLVGGLLQRNYLLQEGNSFLSVIVVSDVVKAPRIPSELIETIGWESTLSVCETKRRL